MISLTNTQRRILNAAVDDFENLEQIYRSICLDFSSEKYNASNCGAFYWRESADAIPLSEIVDAIQSLVDQGLFAVRLAEGTFVTATASDQSYLWRGWFAAMDAGKAALSRAD
jgi:hypothetical protein